MVNGFTERMGRLIKLSGVLGCLAVSFGASGEETTGILAEWLPDDGVGGYLEVGNWSDGGLWDGTGGLVPGVGADVSLYHTGLGFDSYTIHLDVDAQVQSVGMMDEDAHLVAVNKTFIVREVSNFYFGNLDFSSVVFTDDTGIGELPNGRVYFGEGRVANRDLFNGVFKGESFINHGEVFNRGNLWVRGASSDGILTIENGVVNSGLIDLDSTGDGFARLNLGGGKTLVNTLDGLVRFGDGGTQKARYFLGHLENLGEVLIAGQTTFSRAGARVSTSGEFTIAETGKLTIYSGDTFDVTGGTMTVDGDAQFTGVAGFNLSGGELVLNNGMDLIASTFNYTGGMVSGGGLLSISHGGLSLGAGAGDGGGFRQMGLSTFSGDVQDLMRYELRGTNSNTTVTTGGDVVNDGLMSLDSDGSGYVRLGLVAGGGLTNFGTLHFLNGGTEKARYFSGDLVNEGVVGIEGEAVFERAGARYINSGEMHVVEGGSLRVNDAEEFRLSGGTFVVDGGLMMDGVAGFNLYGGELVLNHRSSYTDTVFNYVGGMVSGGFEMDFTGGGVHIWDLAGNAGRFNMYGTGDYWGNLQSEMVLFVGGTASNTTIFVGAGFVNAGELVLNSSAGGYAKLVMEEAGTLKNEGELSFLNGGTQKVRYFFGNLENDGLVLVEGNTFFNQAGARVVNTGEMVIGETGKLTVDNGALFRIVDGVVRVDGRLEMNNVGAFDLEGGELVLNGTSAYLDTVFNYRGGMISGGGTMVFTGGGVNLGAGAGNGGRMSFRGMALLGGDLQSEMRVEILGTSADTEVMTRGDVLNAGEIVLNSTGGGYARLTMVVGGKLHNQGLLHFANGGNSKSRYFAGDLDNGGAVLIEGVTHFERAGSVYTNEGVFKVGVSGTLTIESGLSFSQDGGLMTMDGTLQVNNTGSFNLNGGELALNGVSRFVSTRFNYNGGLITGDGVLVLTGGRLHLGSGGGNSGDFRQHGGSKFSGKVQSGMRWGIIGTSGNTTVTTVGSVLNYGEVNLDGTGGGYARLAMGVGETFTNVGSLSFLNGGNQKARYFDGDLTSSGTVLISGETTFGRAGSRVINRGKFTVEAGGSLTVEDAREFSHDVNTFLVDGELRMNNVAAFNLNGGQLILNGVNDFTGTVFNYRGGMVSGTSEMVMLHSTINIGDDAGDGGSFRLSGASLFSGDLKSGMRLDVMGTSSNTTVTTSSDVVNEGVINLDSTAGGNARFYMGAGMTLSNGGELNFLNGGTQKQRTFGGHLVNEAGGVVRVSSPTSFNRAGSRYDNYGEFVLEGMRLMMTGAHFINHEGGVVMGDGTLDFSGLDLFENEGVFSPGMGIGQIKITGAYLQGDEGTLKIELGESGSFDRLIMTGEARLDGTLEVDVLDGFDGVIGSSYDILVADSIRGEFDILDLTTVSGTGFRVDYYEDRVRLVLISQAVFGDTDFDFDVDQDDLDNVMSYFGTDSRLGDGTGDGVTDLSDLFAVRNNFGNSLTGVAGSVPEPSVLGLMLVGGMLVGRRRVMSSLK